MDTDQEEDWNKINNCKGNWPKPSFEWVKYNSFFLFHPELCRVFNAVSSLRPHRNRSDSLMMLYWCLILNMLSNSRTRNYSKISYNIYLSHPSNQMENQDIMQLSEETHWGYLNIIRYSWKMLIVKNLQLLKLNEMV